MDGAILVVDDEATNRELLAEMLEMQGYRVVTAGDGRQALAEFARVQPSLVLSGVLMPQLNGFESAGVSRAIRSRG